MATHVFDAVHMSLGAITLEDAQMREAFTALFARAGQQGSVRSFDPNLRTNMISGGAESYRALFEAFLAHIDIIKLSDDDLEFLYGKDASFEEVVRKWFTLGPKLAIVTQGAEGSTAFYPNPERKGIRGQIKTPPPGTRPNTVDVDGAAAPVVDTVGCGDTFQGSFISGMLSSASFEYVGKDAPLMKATFSQEWTETAVVQLKHVLERAALCAAVNASRAGCNPPSAAESMSCGKKLGLAFAKAA